MNPDSLTTEPPDDGRYKIVGEKEISFSGYQDGDIDVVATTTASTFAPHARVRLNIGSPHGYSPGAIVATLTLDQADDLIARLTQAKKLVLDAADHTVESTHEIGGDVVRLVRSSLGRWGVAYYDNGGAQGEDGAAWRYDWYDTEAEARSEHADAIEHEICEGCWCPRWCPRPTPCPATTASTARTTPVRHYDPTSCDFAGMMSDCTIEDDSILCPKCGEYMEPAVDEPVLGEIAEPGEGSVPSC